jgi:imidazolonepropionase-like amidohydrolase
MQLGAFDDTGQIKPGLRADLAVWDEHPAELAYRID